MAYEFKLTRRVEFCETDTAGIVHFSNFFRYMEAAECAFFRSLGSSIWTPHITPQPGWPRVKAQCEFRHPLRFDDEIEVHLLVKEKRTKAITYAFRIRKMNAQPPVVAARGEFTAVCVHFEHGKPMTSMAIPHPFSALIEAAPRDVLESFLR